MKPVEDIPYFHKAGFPPLEIGACSPYNTQNGGFVKTLFLLILGSTLSEAKLSGHKTGESRRVGRFIKMCQNTPPALLGGMNGLPSPLGGEGLPRGVIQNTPQGKGEGEMIL